MNNEEWLFSRFCSILFIYQWFPILRDFLFSEYYGLISYSFVETACMYDNALIEQKITHGHAFWLFHCYKKYKRYFFQNNFPAIYLYVKEIFYGNVRWIQKYKGWIQIFIMSMYVDKY